MELLQKREKLRRVSETVSAFISKYVHLFAGCIVVLVLFTLTPAGRVRSPNLQLMIADWLIGLISIIILLESFKHLMV